MPCLRVGAMPEWGMRLLKVLFGLVLLGIVAAVGGAFFGLKYWEAAGPLQTETTVLVMPGQGPRAIGATLQGMGVVRHAEAFVLAVRVMGIANKLKAGEYVFEPGESLKDVVARMAKGDAENRSVTIPEGWTVRQVLERLDATPGLKGDVVRPAEGSIFPDTYAFQFGSERKKILEAMEARMRDEVAKAWAVRKADLPLTTPEDLVNLASIVQKEAANEQEMPMVAAVFINRLKTGMRLQSDPTVMYGAEELGGGRLKKKDLTEPHPFNTYIYAGLPPTPISNPGRAALMAVAQPADTKALFFVADPSLTMHVFSDTYEEHVKNVKRYWKDVGKALKETVISATNVVVSASQAVSSTVKALQQGKAP